MARRRPTDPRGWLAVAWLLVALPAVVLTFALMGLPIAALVAGAALAPAFGVWLLRQRTAVRIGRFGGRRRVSRGAPRRSPSGGSSESRGTSEDARRR